jgi:hypothetical protein
MADTGLMVIVLMAFMTTTAGMIAQFITVIGATIATTVIGKLSQLGNNP